MKVLVHDYCGHPFQIQLSRWLAQQGHQVQHSFSTDIESPRGNLGCSDASQLSIVPLGSGRPLPKYNLTLRLLHEAHYARLAADSVIAMRPDIVLSGNTPPTIQAALQKAARKSGAGFIYWVQDIFSAVLDRVLPGRIPVIGSAIAKGFRRFEFRVMAKSDGVVVISEDFVDLCAREGVSRDNIAVIRNWAPLSEIAPAARDNDWAKAHGLADKFVLLFSGTLGLKHNPGLLLRLAEALRRREDAVVVVISQGLGRQWLECEMQKRDLPNLRLYDFQPFIQLPNVLASADILLAILEPFAGELSVPSKILSYLCARRPLLAALPPRNLAGRIITDAGAGCVVSPLDEDGFVAAADSLAADAARRERCAIAARSYAEHHFDIDRIGSRFLEVFHRAAISQRAAQLREGIP